MSVTKAAGTSRQAAQREVVGLGPTELRRRRRALRLTQAQLAERLAVSANTVARWERGELRVGHPRQVAHALARLERSHPIVADGSAGDRRARRTPHAAERRPTALLGRRRHQLPAELNSFVGRALELRRLADRLASARLLTLVGPGGVGKTRLARQFGTRVRDNYLDGVWLVELASLADARMVANAVAAALGIRERGRTPLARTLAETLHDQRLLLVLDNCEHVLEGCAELAHDLLRACPYLTILATSREPLRLSGEVRWPVPPLSVGFASDDAAEASEAVQLFVERARAVDPGFALTADNRDVLAEVCARLDGLPLAIELAAARVRSIPPRALLDQLHSAAGGLPLLTGGPRDVPARQQTLRATIAWSYDLLDPEERTLFRRLAPFHGCTLEAVAAVCVRASEGSRTTSVDLPPLHVDARAGLASLVDKSLLRMEEDGQGQAWYVLLETVREFALERLEASPEAAAVWRRHAWYHLGLAEQTEAGPAGMRQEVFLNHLEREHPNFRAALDWCQAHGYAEASLRLGVGLVWFWGVRGHLAEGRRRLEALLARFPLRTTSGSRGVVHAKALDALGRMAAMQSDLGAALDFQRRSLALFENLGHVQGVCVALEGLAFILRQQGDLDAARVCFERSLVTARSLGSATPDPGIVVLVVSSLCNLGRLAHDQGDDDTAVAQLQEAIRLTDALGENSRSWFGPRLDFAGVLRDMGEHDRARAMAESVLHLCARADDRRGVGLALTELGSIATAQGDFAAAYDHLSRSLRLSQEFGEPSAIAFVLDRFAVLASAQAQHERALRLTGAAARLRDQAGTPPSAAIQEQLDQQVEAARRALGRSAAPTLAAGRALSLAAAIAEAQVMDPSATTDRSASATHVLSPREREVAMLVGRGQTNRQIATGLVVSEATVATHVQHVLAKLDLRSRAQIAAWVARNELFDDAHSHPGGDHAAVPR